MLLFCGVSISWEFLYLETDLEHTKGLWESPVRLRTLGPSDGHQLSSLPPRAGVRVFPLPRKSTGTFCMVQTFGQTFRNMSVSADRERSADAVG